MSVDSFGLDEKKRIVAYYGSPVLDGELDEVWGKAQEVIPQYISKNAEARATFKVLWDDNALYILANVKDKDMSVQSVQPYQHDCMEIFLDENNDKGKEYNVDDSHIRVNYENYQTVDQGDALRFYAVTKTYEGGYLIQARISLREKPENDRILGIELQINDAKGKERIGTLNVFDKTGWAWCEPRLFGEVILKGKSEDCAPKLNVYDLKCLMASVAKIKFENYSNSYAVKDELANAHSLLERNIAVHNFDSSQETQQMVDDQYNELNTAISQLELTEEAANIKEFTPVPSEYYRLCDRKGTIEHLSYETKDAQGQSVTKQLNVYLPYGYDALDSTKKYNVYYLMHGGGENESTLFGGVGEERTLKRIIDHRIANGEIDPLIVVTPTFYGGKNDIALFHEELMEAVIPLIETKYHTYAAAVDKASLKATRAHRAFGGFSMGSACTWYNYIHCLDYIKYFTPYSGECWVFGQTDPSKAKQSAEYIRKVTKEYGYTPKEYYLFCATGSGDIAYPNMAPMMAYMKEMKDTFIDSADINKGNFYFIVCEGGTHAWNYVNQYIYDILPDLFKAEK